MDFFASPKFWMLVVVGMVAFWLFSGFEPGINP